ncbi:MAG: four-carbon acid sugar kinase family protein [Candidatus Latescibacteria bacterium]|nr:four-carbon acid sugar kinase family protein [Candidatus Latescibacterota bacterium]
MTPPRLLMLADDLTGAADAAGYFARSGLRTLVRFAPGQVEGAEVLALSTHSRHLAPETAARAQGQALAQAGGWVSGAAVYKKIDSTLRGHPAVELAAVLAALGRRRVLVAPAFPSQRRTTVGACMYVDGLPLGQTSFGGEGDLRQAFGTMGLPMHPLPLPAVRAPGLAGLLQEEGCWLADAEVDEDLHRLARASLDAGIDLWCGSAGLARALGGVLWPEVGEQPSLPGPDSMPVLVVAGTRHARTQEQVAALVRGGAVLGAPQQEGLLRALLATGRTVVLSARGLPEGEPEQVAAMLAGAAGQLLDRGQVGGVVLTGGDTALAVCLGLGSSGIWLRGEVEPGIPWGVLADGPHAGLRVVTKAGGFGGPEALVQAVALLGGGPTWN